MSAIEREAFAWVVRLTSGKATAADADALQAWCAQSPAHQAAFARAQRQWHSIKAAGSQVSNWTPLRAGGAAGGSVRLRRRALIGGALAAPAAIALALWRPPLDLWPSAGELKADYRTATGERRRVELSEHAVLDLDTRTSILVRGALQEIEMIAGQVAIETDGGVPFAVRAGTGRTTADAGAARFDVRCIGQEVRVTCLSGSVRVNHLAGVHRLQAMQQMSYDQRAIAEAVPADPEEASAWREGVLVFRRVPLARVVDELNRYRPGKVIVLNDRIAALPVSGRFLMDDPDAVLEQLRLALDLSVSVYPGGIAVLA
ncbi:FecR family protein [Pseudothauera rhizosphaerae]|uniref:FecR family protein n=1 Tax=Pseudothauera rhizosphaerae TaxID=2565932 RepID=UPI001B3B257E|nr:DUF4880 domain-containing protein [Pseudothauera rhizosphaerae]